MFKKIIFFILMTAVLSGCNALPEQRIIQAPIHEIATANPDEPETEVYQNYTFSEDDELFLASCIFIGDSIFGNLTDIGILRAEQVFFGNGLKVSDIANTRFPLPSGDGETYLLTALVNHNPENVILLLGTNDVTVTAPESFAAEYVKLISFIKTYCPDTIITVLSITPVNRESGNLTNDIINEYNSIIRTALRELGDTNVRFLDLASELKNSHGRLKSRFAQDDGVHLTAQGLHAILWVICNNMN